MEKDILPTEGWSEGPSRGRGSCGETSPLKPTTEMTAKFMSKFEMKPRNIFMTCKLIKITECSSVFNMKLRVSCPRVRLKTYEHEERKQKMFGMLWINILLINKKWFELSSLSLFFSFSLSLSLSFSLYLYFFHCISMSKCFSICVCLSKILFFQSLQ